MPEKSGIETSKKTIRGNEPVHDRKQLLVGVIFIAGIIILAVIAFSGQRVFNRDFVFYIEFESAQGLQKGDLVYLKGVRTGSIEEVVLEGDNPVVKAAIERKYEVKLTADSFFYIEYENRILNKKCIIWEQGISSEHIVENAIIAGYESKLGARTGKVWEQTKQTGEAIVEKTRKGVEKAGELWEETKERVIESMSSLKCAHQFVMCDKPGSACAVCGEAILAAPAREHRGKFCRKCGLAVHFDCNQGDAVK